MHLYAVIAFSFFLKFAFFAMGVRVQTTAKAGSSMSSRLLTRKIPFLDLFKRPSPHFIAEKIQFDRQKRGASGFMLFLVSSYFLRKENKKTPKTGPVSLYREKQKIFVFSGSKAPFISADDANNNVHLGPTVLNGFLSSDDALASHKNKEWYNFSILNYFNDHHIYFHNFRYLARLNTFQNDAAASDGIWSYTVKRLSFLIFLIFLFFHLFLFIYFIILLILFCMLQSTSSCEGSPDTFLGGHW